MTVDVGIREFWAWWETARHRVLSAIEVEKNFSRELIEDISKHVDAIGDLAWELAPGKTAKHAFCLSPNGDPEARLVTELWRHNSPPPDPTWEYYAARQARDLPRIKLHDVTLDRGELMGVIEVDKFRERINGTYFHPAFAKLAERQRMTALYLMLDGLFGEDGVERWLGAIKASEAPLESAVALPDFIAAVAELERTATGQQGAILEGKTKSGEPLFVSCNTALKRIDHLLYTMHVAIDLAILDQNAQGLTTQTDAAVLDRIQDELEEALGERVVYFGRETRPGHRVIHWYAAEDGAVQGIIERWAQRHADRRPNVEWARDPTWKFVKRYV